MNAAEVTILGINGSPRKCSTGYVLQQALDAAAEATGVKTELLNLADMRMEGCNQCDYCARQKSHCHHQDDFTPQVMAQFVQADGYVIASPVYNMNITWKLLTFFNRFRPLHKVYPPDILAGKVGGAIAVGGTRQGGQATAIQAIHQFYFCRQILVAGGGKGGYSGGAVWSHDSLNETRLDEVGLETARSVAIRVAKTAKLLRAGQSLLLP